VDPIGGEWGKQAYWLRDSYVAIGRAVAPIVSCQGTDRLFSFVQEAGERGATYEAELCNVQVTYNDRDGMARGMVLELSPTEFVILGSGFSARFRQKGVDAPFHINRADWGCYEGETFRLLHPMRRERLEAEGLPVPLLEPGVARVLLKTSNN
jgi:hypothetical protein